MLYITGHPRKHVDHASFTSCPRRKGATVVDLSANINSVPSTTDEGSPRMYKALGRTLALLLAAGAVALVVTQHSYRGMEVRLAALVLDGLGFGNVGVVPDRPSVFFLLGTDHPMGIKMTAECTSVFLIIPLVLLAAVLVAFRPQNGPRVLLALLISSAMLIMVNQLRLVDIALLADLLGGPRGYHWGHTVGGSLISIFGGAVTLVVFFWLTMRRNDRETEMEAA
ncbi:exosortase/archaeosortase family protein [Pseudonocardiaceae bacterium YIM PH 21723]|nr:exosortase/archaeosortase family protein [Pseudonocardiaceae bacterium YIM PH 21723]